MAFQDRAMLISLRLTCWTGEKSARAVAREVTEAKNADDGSASVIVRLVPAAALKEIRSVDARLRAVHHHYTLPWLDGGQRVLPTTAFLEHSQAVSALMSERTKVIDKFAALYPSIREAAKDRLGALYNPDMWPDEVASEFTQSVKHLPIPSGADFRADMDETDVARLREEVEATVNDQLRDAMLSVRSRIKTTLEAFISRVGDYKVEVTADGVKTTGIFRNTVLDDLTRLVDVLPMLNLTSDFAVAQVGRDIRDKIVKYTPDTLRDDDAVRAQVIADAKALARGL